MRYLCTYQCGFVITCGDLLFHVNPLEQFDIAIFFPLNTENVGVPLKMLSDKETIKINLPFLSGFVTAPKWIYDSVLQKFTDT